MEELETVSITPREEEPEQPLSSQTKAIYIGVAIALALFSAVILGGHFTQPEAYPTTIQTLDAKRTTVLALATAATGASIAVSAIPDDTGTPVAESLADLSGDFMMILAMILLQKYLLTTFGMAAFQFLIPISCLIFVFAILSNASPLRRGAFVKLAEKLFALAIVLFACVPLGSFISNSIEATYQASIDMAINQAQGTVEKAETSESDAAANNADQGEATESGPLESAMSFVGNAKDAIASKASEVIDSATSAATNLFEAFAVMLVTSLFIPILTFALMLWLAGMILGINVNLPLRAMTPRVLRRIKGKQQI